MIEPSDFIPSDRSSSPGQADRLAFRLVELRCSPIQGSFDSAHLQNIHHHLYRDLDVWVGELKMDNSENIERQLDQVLDRLAAENHLRNLDRVRWAEQASDYLAELERIQPFRAGNGVTLREFMSELARKNQLDLQWTIFAETSSREAPITLQEEARSASLRRILMLVMDNDPVPLRPSRGDTLTRSIDDAFQIHLP